MAIIGSVWALSAVAFSPWYLYFGIHHWETQFSDVVDGNLTNVTLEYEFCMANWPSRVAEIMTFVMLNITLAFLVPLCAILVLYVRIFRAIFNRKSIAVDNQATFREHRLRVRVTHMMLAVVITFVICWLPIYALFAVLLYRGQGAPISPATNILRPVFQWLSLANSCLNPILYASFSAKFRLAFLEIIVLPCRRRYGNFRRFAQTTIRRVSDKRTISVSPTPSRQALGQNRKKFLTNRRTRRLLPQENAGDSAAQSHALSLPTFGNFMVINEKYVDDGQMISIPIFEKISSV